MDGDEAKKCKLSFLARYSFLIFVPTKQKNNDAISNQ